MNVATVTTADMSLLHGVRKTLDDADDVFLCVAFVHERGLYLLEKELEALQRRRGQARLLVTTTYKTADSALALAQGFGMKPRVLNPGGQSFHPKLYLGRSDRHAAAVIGSANLTAGLANNLEVAVALRGRDTDPPIAHAWASRCVPVESTATSAALIRRAGAGRRRWGQHYENVGTEIDAWKVAGLRSHALSSPP